jgi:hypothetical protein
VINVCVVSYPLKLKVPNALGQIGRAPTMTELALIATVMRAVRASWDIPLIAALVDLMEMMVELEEDGLMVKDILGMMMSYLRLTP